MIHVYPLFGREHQLKGTMCWCRPTVEWDLPESIVIHKPVERWPELTTALVYTLARRGAPCDQ